MLKSLLHLSVALTIDVLGGLFIAWLFNIELTAAMVGLLLVYTKLNEAVAIHLLKKSGERSET